jgi:hypothetical protein
MPAQARPVRQRDGLGAAGQSFCSSLRGSGCDHDHEALFCRPAEFAAGRMFPRSPGAIPIAWGDPAAAGAATTKRSSRDSPIIREAAKMIAPFEISDVRPADHGGPGAYYVCLREANPPPEKRRRYYAIFFDGDAPKGFRLSVIMDECEKQTFNPLPAGPATPLPADNTQQPTEHKKHRGASAA